MKANALVGVAGTDLAALWWRFGREFSWVYADTQRNLLRSKIGSFGYYWIVLIDIIFDTMARHLTCHPLWGDSLWTKLVLVFVQNYGSKIRRKGQRHQNTTKETLPIQHLGQLVSRSYFPSSGVLFWNHTSGISGSDIRRWEVYQGIRNNCERANRKRKVILMRLDLDLLLDEAQR
jgi:hypothetical protein